MPGPTLTAEELAEELGRSVSYVYDNWRRLVKQERLPVPLNGGKPPLVWSRAQIYAWLDRGLDKEARIAAQAYRAAAAAAAGARHVPAATLEEERWRAYLDAKFAS